VLRFPLLKQLAGRGVKLAAEARGATGVRIAPVLGSMDDARFPILRRARRRNWGGLGASESSS
jgi:hypothetical protein